MLQCELKSKKEINPSESFASSWITEEIFKQYFDFLAYYFTNDYHEIFRMFDNFLLLKDPGGRDTEWFQAWVQVMYIERKVSLPETYKLVHKVCKSLHLGKESKSFIFNSWNALSPAFQNHIKEEFNGLYTDMLYHIKMQNR